MTFLHLSVPRVAPKIKPTCRIQSCSPGAERDQATAFPSVWGICGMGPQGGWNIHETSLQRGQKKIITKNSSLFTQCHTNPWEIALSMGLLGMRLYRKILAGFNYPLFITLKVLLQL